MRKKQRLKILQKILISLFIIFGAAAILLAGIRKTRIEARQKQEAMEALKNVPTVAPTVSVTPSPSPTPRPTATPTPVPTVVAAFDPNDFWDYWYSTDGTATINVYDISLDKISFSFYQTDRNQSQSVSADVTGRETSGCRFHVAIAVINPDHCNCLIIVVFHHSHNHTSFFLFLSNPINTYVN